MENEARNHGAQHVDKRANGAHFVLNGRTYVTNYDGSQDEGEVSNDDVLHAFFAPFRGADDATWPTDAVHLIAINEGRLVDFLSDNRDLYSHLGPIIEHGLKTGASSAGVAVVNLNLRSVVAGEWGSNAEGQTSILTRLLRTLTAPDLWQPCEACDLKERCYVYHNVQTFQDPVVGPKVMERLQTLHVLVHLRGERHTTLRNLRSALAFMLAGTRNCDEIHELYAAGQRDTVIQSFYFNSWMGGDAPNEDPLIRQLKELDIAQISDPPLDRALSFASPVDDRLAFTFAERSDYDRAVLRKLFDELPVNHAGISGNARPTAFQTYLAFIRRRMFFERRDANWRQMLPYRSASRMLALIRGDQPLEEPPDIVLHALNRGEGLMKPEVLGNRLAVRVRHVERGTIRSYRLFSGEHFTLEIDDAASRARFVEHLPAGLVLRYAGVNNVEAELRINLDVFELLERLNEGYRPSIEDEQGVYRTLAIFKNILGSEPYQEVLLTTTGHDFYRIERAVDGALAITRPES